MGFITMILAWIMAPFMFIASFIGHTFFPGDWKEATRPELDPVVIEGVTYKTGFLPKGFLGNGALRVYPGICDETPV
jgi:uncharacterized membrane protein YphA (DoxX/SURF4 family)